MMTIGQPADSGQFEPSFKVFHDLMARRVKEILLISSPYDAFIMEEEGRLAGRIVQEYRGLNLSQPPRLTWAATARQAFETLSSKRFDLVITMPRVGDMDALALAEAVKSRSPDLPIFLLAHSTAKAYLETLSPTGPHIDGTYVWLGNSDLLLALVKSVEDRMNVDFDTRRAKVRVILFVEDSPYYLSSLLPILYKEIVMQTQMVMEDSLNEDDRILRMRARPKILSARNYEEAEAYFLRFKPYLLSVISDVRFAHNGRIDNSAGFALLRRIRREFADLPMLTISSEEANRAHARQIPAAFINKHSDSLHGEIRRYFVKHLGFGDFVFRQPDGREVGRVSNLRDLEKILPTVPDESIYCHAAMNDFSSWLMARSEVGLASKLRPIKASDFENPAEIKAYLIQCIHARRRERQKGIVTEFDAGSYDPLADFIKVGKGSLGGKARGLAFMSTRLAENDRLRETFPQVDIRVPETFVLSTDSFDAFIAENGLEGIGSQSRSDEDLIRRFTAGRVPDGLQKALETFLKFAGYPLAVRSSSLLEDAYFQPFAGVYRTYMIPNNDRDPLRRLAQLIQAVKLVYASIYLTLPKTYAKSTRHRIEEEKMSVVIQRLTGERYGEYFYPAISGVAQSYNFYPIGHLKSREGIAHIALGLGKTVVEGGTVLRFVPKHPQFLPQFSSVDDTLKNSQTSFYALKMTEFPDEFDFLEDATLTKVHLDEAADHPAVRLLSSTYDPQEHRIRDDRLTNGYPILTFAGILKHNLFPLPGILTELLDIGSQGMGCPVEIEFAVNFPATPAQKPEFHLLQIRPMAVAASYLEVAVTPEDIQAGVCYSSQALGNGTFRDIADIVYVKPDAFEPARTTEIAAQISGLNQKLISDGRKYILIGPGRWGSADRWLGIPVKWNDINGVRAIIETEIESLRTDASQGSHFFHNIISFGIGYLTVKSPGDDFIDWSWLRTLPLAQETDFIALVRPARRLTLKIDGRTSQAVLMP